MKSIEQVETVGEEASLGFESAIADLRSPEYWLAKVHGLNPKTRLHFTVSLRSWRRDIVYEGRDLLTICELARFLLAGHPYPNHSWHIGIKSFNRTKPSSHRLWRYENVLLKQAHLHMVQMAFLHKNPYILLPLLSPGEIWWQTKDVTGKINSSQGLEISRSYRTATNRIPIIQAVFLNEGWVPLRR
jgi:hypothetical protein